MHWCGSNRIVTGVHVDQNGLGCANYLKRDQTFLPAGTPFFDGADGVNPTQRSGMHARLALS
jgi:hypothetical protein